MTWVDKLFDEIKIRRKSNNQFEEGYIGGAKDTQEALVLAVLEKHKEIEIKVINKYNKLTFRKPEYYQARAFKELVKKCQEVKTNE